MNAIAHACNVLRQAGWSVDAYEVVNLLYGILWVVEARKGEQFIRVQARSASEAWKEAAELTCKVG